ncbi:MAG TPA: PstS family phosphate ABC transporter substrate-binding protein [Polyangiaceae bacterium]|nr:PstS family phosphate ABC transporter substrate-binding protein [Polyangiaceae bacterium]
MKKFVLLAAIAVGCKQQEPAPDPGAPAPTPAAALAAAPAKASGARDYINIVGSSTVYPFSTVVAEQFGKTTKFKAPKVESTGTGGGLKLFCDGVGVKFPDIANASRRIKPSEVAQCKQNGVTDIVELKIGYDGIVLANSKQAKPLVIDLHHLWLALAKEVPGDNPNQLKPNTYATWAQVDPGLPDIKIEVLGPPPTSGTRDAFVELAMQHGCSHVDWIKALEKSDEKRFKSICHTIREDGAFIEAGENDNLIVQKLEANPAAFGVFGYSFLDQNTEKVQAASIDGVAPTFDSIAEGKYPVSRPLYVYVKKAHVGVIPGIAEYLSEFTAPRASGPEGYLADKGMIPMPDAERTEYRAIAVNLTPLVM